MASSSTLLSQIRERRNMVRAHHILPPHFFIKDGEKLRGLSATHACTAAG